MTQTLTAVPASGQQTTTSDPQEAGSASTGNKTSAIQPGTPTNALNSTQGVGLQAGQLSTVALPTTRTSTVVRTDPVSHHKSPVLTTVSIVLLVIAIGLFALMAREDKSTTSSS
jgi:hypothetical protein